MNLTLYPLYKREKNRLFLYYASMKDGFYRYDWKIIRDDCSVDGSQAD